MIFNLGAISEGWRSLTHRRAHIHGGPFDVMLAPEQPANHPLEGASVNRITFSLRVETAQRWSAFRRRPDWPFRAVGDVRLFLGELLAHNPNKGRYTRGDESGGGWAVAARAYGRPSGIGLSRASHCPKGGDDFFGSLSFNSSRFHYLFQKGSRPCENSAY